MIKIVFVILVLIAGMLAPVQAGVNFILSQHVKSFFMAALISFIVGSIGLFLYCVFTKVQFPKLHTFIYSPWWIWLGGLCGAFLVTVTIAAVPKLGATTMFAVFLAGQMIASLILDHFGLLNYPIHTLNIWRVIGVILLFAGVFLIKKF